MIKFLFCGDFVSQNPKSIEFDNNLKSLFAEQDFIAVNFEAPIRGFGTPIPKSGPSLTQSEDSPIFLESLGVNIIQLANNHMMDQGKEACKKTISCFQKSTILGAGLLDDAYKLSIVEKDGLRIGLLCMVHKEFGALGIDSLSSDYGVAWINHPKINQLILESKQHCDLLVVLPHAGVEDVIVPLPEWRARYKEFIDLGADAVIASHPHTPQGWEEYKGKMIYYSLGNLFFQLFSNQHGANWFKGLMVQMAVNDDQSLSFDVYNTLFSDTTLSIDDTTKAEEYNKYLCKLLSDDKKYWDYLNGTLMALWPEYKLYMLRGLAAVNATTNLHVLAHAAYGLLKGADTPMLLNNFQCESHRWAIERMLNLQLRKQCQNV